MSTDEELIKNLAVKHGFCVTCRVSMTNGSSGVEVTPYAPFSAAIHEAIRRIRLQDAERLEARVRSILQTAQTDEEYKPHAQAHSFHLLECSAGLRKLAEE